SDDDGARAANGLHYMDHGCCWNGAVTPVIFKEFKKYTFINQKKDTTRTNNQNELLAQRFP
ncbi:hypothetical protein ACQ1ZU_15780, partial [Enterococcus faecalis]|uniref:hypothetical protein n=1 Tax=Enterococcus faecalis TaxID=1351 RepID=UPI003D6B068B